MSTVKRTAALFGSLTVLLFILTVGVKALPPENQKTESQSALTVDNTKYINANRILMFVTNHGNFGRDLGGVFGHDYGTYYPYVSNEDLQSGANISSVLYGAGLWLGGVDSLTGDTLVSASEFTSEYVPGPMLDGSYQSDRPEFRVFKLYRDSLANNPNQDYLQWPIDQGAPVDGSGHPVMLGDQMTWSVCNDANPAQHTNRTGQTAPMGIEVQQTVWAVDQDGDIEIRLNDRYIVHGPTAPTLTVTAVCADPVGVNGHEYAVATDSTFENGFVWHLIDLTESETVLANQTDFDGTEITVEGIRLTVRLTSLFKSFECVANAGGILDPVESAAPGWQGFPTPRLVDANGYPTDNQQVGPAKWLFHTGDNGGTTGGGTRASYAAFLPRVMRSAEDGGGRLARIAAQDWEMRFTGSYANPGVGGGYAWDAFRSKQGYWVPFELWRIGIDTPDDPSDDVRLIPWIVGDVLGDGSNDDFVFDLSQYGGAAAGSCHDGCEHSVSGGDNDPYTDWVYWRMPEDPSPGQSGYNAFEAAMISNPTTWPGNEAAIMDRTVLVSWNAEVTPPFTQDLPEQGTVFRLRTSALVAGQSYTFRADPSRIITSGPLGTTMFVKYRLINKGIQTLKNLFICLWQDADLGVAGNDLVGCDPSQQMFYYYNGTEDDAAFSGPPPTLGFRILEGPIVYSIGDVAYVDGLPVPDYRNMGMYAFTMYINGTDPVNHSESYMYMRGLDAKNNGAPFYNPTTGQPTRYVLSGDPVAGTGWIDNGPSDRRTMASFGPITFRPGATQQVVFKMVVGQGADRLSSITALRNVLDYEYNPFSCCIGRVGDANGSNEPTDEITLGDIMLLVDVKFISGDCSKLPCLTEADVNQDGGANPTCDDHVTLGDIMTLVDFLFITGPDVAVLPECL